jgi:hypothetical protein
MVEGKPGERDFEAIFIRGGVPIAGLTVDRPRAIPTLKKRIERGHFPAQDRALEAA